MKKIQKKKAKENDNNVQQCNYIFSFADCWQIGLFLVMEVWVLLECEIWDGLLS